MARRDEARGGAGAAQWQWRRSDTLRLRVHRLPSPSYSASKEAKNKNADLVESEKENKLFFPITLFYLFILSTITPISNNFHAK